MNGYQMHPVYGGEHYQPNYACHNYAAQSQCTPVASQTVQNCDCPTPPFMPVNPQLARAYVPYQQHPSRMFPPKEALYKGTVFPELYKPYVPTKR